MLFLKRCGREEAWSARDDRMKGDQTKDSREVETPHPLKTNREDLSLTLKTHITWASLTYSNVTAFVRCKSLTSFNDLWPLLLSSVTRKLKRRWPSTPCWIILASAVQNVSAVTLTVSEFVSLSEVLSRGRTTTAAVGLCAGSSCPVAGGSLGSWVSCRDCPHTRATLNMERFDMRYNKNK